jgi:hypothetical protein
LSSGNLTVVLEPFNCFDAEVYADELELDEPIEFRDDQRGKLIVSCSLSLAVYPNILSQSALENGSCGICSPISSMKRFDVTSYIDKS